MSETQATHDEAQSHEVAIYMSGFPTADQETDTESERFQIARDLRGFGTDAFAEFGVDPQHAADVAYEQLGDTVEVPAVKPVGELLESIFKGCQGPRKSSVYPYDGTRVRSMQVGDVVVVDDTPYMVDDFGFTKLDDVSFD